MGYVNLRLFECSTRRDRTGQLLVDDIGLVRQEDTSVRLADVVKVNALSVPLRAPASYRVLQHELRLLLSYLPDRARAPLGLRLADFRASSSHIRRFVSESVGLGMLTAAVQDVYGWPHTKHSLHHFDVLPPHLAGKYAAGIRPDLLFRFGPVSPTRLLGGEARGRSTRRHKATTISAAQRRRLDHMVAWSGRHDDHAVTMTWAFIGSTQVEVDLFRVQQPPLVAVAPEPDERPTAVRPAQPERGLRTDAILDIAQQKAEAISEQLYRTSPPFDQERGPWGRSMRGDWVTADLVGPSTTHLLLGVLDQAPEPDALARLRARRYDRLDDVEAESIQIETLGRLFVVVARDRERPQWQEVANRIE